MGPTTTPNASITGSTVWPATIEYSSLATATSSTRCTSRTWRALRLVAEEGTPGEAYNVAARQLSTLDQCLEHIADGLDRDVEFVHASERELAGYDLGSGDFPLVRPVPVIIDTAKLAALGWESSPQASAIDRTVKEHLDSDRTGRHHGPDREVERRAIDDITS